MTPKNPSADENKPQGTGSHSDPIKLPVPSDLPEQAKAATNPVPETTVVNVNVGDQIMAKGREFNAQWSVCKVVENPTDTTMPLIEFPDGRRFIHTDVELGGKVSSTSQPTAESLPSPAVVSPLLEDYKTFKDIVVRLNQNSIAMFQLPLDVLLTMMTRFATQSELEGSGKMANYGGVSIFVPDQQTFDKWLESYLLEIQRREVNTGQAE